MTDDGFFDEDVAQTYDTLHGASDARLIDKTVNRLLELAGGGDILEFAVGTGRIALPLIQKGARVKGIEMSRAMVAKLREKEAGPPMDVTIGDMTETHVPGPFALVYLVFNTIDNLTTQEAQIACFENAARHLDPGGRFVVETLVPPLQKIPFGETKLAFACDADHFGIDEFNVATQHYRSHHAWLSDAQHRHLSIPFRYVWPSELDLMARIAGLALEFRWSDWDGAPFDRMSTKHVSVWRKR